MILDGVCKLEGASSTFDFLNRATGGCHLKKIEAEMQMLREKNDFVVTFSKCHRMNVTVVNQPVIS